MEALIVEHKRSSGFNQNFMLHLKELFDQGAFGEHKDFITWVSRAETLLKSMCSGISPIRADGVSGGPGKLYSGYGL